MKKRLFSSLRKQLAHEIFFVDNVSSTNRDSNECEHFDFEYKNQQFQLVLQGDIILRTEKKQLRVDSFQELLHGLMHINTEFASAH